MSTKKLIDFYESLNQSASNDNSKMTPANSAPTKIPILTPASTSDSASTPIPTFSNSTATLIPSSTLTNITTNPGKTTI